jgi:3-oxoacyl-[acyl-carrier protein] reductase
MMKRFESKTVIITGGASGIGRAAALKFAAEGASVIIWDVDQQKGEATRNEINSQGYDVSFSLLDTTRPEATEQAARDVIDTYQRIDVLINNAGITRDASLQKMSFSDWQAVLDVNLTGVFNCSKAVIPFMIEQQRGRIINTSSVVGLYGNYGQTNYAATKAGVIGMTKTMARELGRYHITVNAVAPGFIATDMVKTIPEKVIQMMREKTALGRVGTPEDIANAYCFLASEEASFISGSVLSVDGALSF